MARACAPALLALALAALALAASPAAAQNSTFGETQLNGTGPVYKKQDSLDPVRQVFGVLYYHCLILLCLHCRSFGRLSPAIQTMPHTCRLCPLSLVDRHLHREGL